MRWLNRIHIDVATVASVAMSAVIAVVAGKLAGNWTWAMFAAFVPAIVLVAGLELVRSRAAHRPADQPDVSGQPDRGGPASVVASGNRSQAAGRDIRNIRVGTGGVGLGAVVMAALLASAGAVALGRQQSGLPILPTESDLAYAREFHDSGILVAARDLDPKDNTSGLSDVSYNSRAGGTIMLNNTSTAPAPAAVILNAGVCRDAHGWNSSPISVEAARTAVTVCLKTSDGHFGTLSLAGAQSDGLGGTVEASWTIWY